MSDTADATLSAGFEDYEKRKHRRYELLFKVNGAQALGSSAQVFLGALAAGIGLDPARDIRWVTDPDEKPLELFAAGKIDAHLPTPPHPQELPARGLRHLGPHSAGDRPCSPYFRCILT